MALRLRDEAYRCHRCTRPTCYFFTSSDPALASKAVFDCTFAYCLNCEHVDQIVKFIVRELKSAAVDLSFTERLFVFHDLYHSWENNGAMSE